MILGKTSEGKELQLNLDRLVETRLLLQANSGGGKSWALRRILEQTHGKVQQIVIDVEDEFATLREHYDYVLAGGAGADCPADTRSAALLARRLLELNTSAIIGIYELKAHDRIRFVRLFLDSLVNAPRELWHPVLVVVDEAHIFCPQHGEAESAAAVIDLMTRGRKRGFCGVLATQRISKLHKDAAAEANNKLIGRSALDVDMKRAGDELGFTGREDLAQLRVLKPGEFFVFGPALSDTIAKLKVGDVRTSHPKAGQHAVAPPPPRERVKAVLAQLADLPKQAETEARTVAELQARIRELEATARRHGSAVPDKAVIEGARFEGATEERIVWNKRRMAWAAELRNFLLQVDPIRALAERMTSMYLPPTVAAAPEFPKDEVHFKRDGRTVAKVVNLAGEAPLKRGQREMLSVLAAAGARGLDRTALAVRACMRQSGSFSDYLSNLHTQGLVSKEGGRIRITPAGMELVDPLDLSPTQIISSWSVKHLKLGQRRMLDAIYNAGERGLTRAEVAEAAEMEQSGSFSDYLSNLNSAGLIEKADGVIRISRSVIE